MTGMFRYSDEGLQCLLSATAVWDGENALRDVGITKGFSRTRGVGTQTNAVNVGFMVWGIWGIK
ncbi:hypothetical protein CQ045_06125 [Microbacterium sp. MYb66]|jgi:hypothetical protein|nr:hypothetical protein CQ045_06125 [Microbacterium sp. MYb66]